MTITRFAPSRRPFAEATLLQHRLNSIFDELGWQPETEAQRSSFVPAVDVYEDAQKVVVKLEVPGIKQEDLSVRLENQTLTVKGERKFENEEKKQNFHRIERSYGSFTRTFTVPQTVETESVKANYDAGVLTISLAKKAEAKPKQIAIEAGPAAVAAVPAATPAAEVEVK
jgi:HSP20 family protein